MQAGGYTDGGGDSPGLAGFGHGYEVPGRFCAEVRQCLFVVVPHFTDAADVEELVKLSCLFEAGYEALVQLGGQMVQPGAAQALGDVEGLFGPDGVGAVVVDEI